MRRLVVGGWWLGNNRRSIAADAGHHLKQRVRMNWTWGVFTNHQPPTTNHRACKAAS